MPELPYLRPLPRWATFLSAAFVVTLLVAWIAVPTVIDTATDKHLDEIRNYVEPADRIMSDIHVSLSHSLSSVEGFQVTEKRAFAELYRDQMSKVAAELVDLQPIAEHLGPAMFGRYQEVNNVIQRWQHSIEENELVTTVLPADVFRDRLFAQDHILETVYQAISDFQLNVYGIRESHRARAEALSHLNILFTVGLTLLSFAAIVVVWRITRRLRLDAIELSQRVREEELIREFSASMIAAVQVQEVLNQVVREAASDVEADGGFVETIGIEADQILVAAGTGIGTPVIGRADKYTGSIAEDLVRSRQYRIIARIELEQGGILGTLRDSCPSCAALVFPLIADGQPVGILFLLRRNREFTRADADRVRLLVTIASLSLRKALLLESSEKRRIEAERAVRSRDEMFRVVSHDLRNPLGNISVAALMLSKGDIGEERRAALLDMIHRLTERMNRIIQDLIDIARAESGQPMPLDVQETSAFGIAEEVCALNRLNAQNKRINLRCDARSQDLFVRVDRHRMIQALSNLVDNAIKFSPEEGTVWLNVDEADSGVEFSVTDSGSGIPEAQVEEIFKPFWRDTHRPEAGLGLGLAIVKRIVELHGSKISVRNEPGAGSTFFFTVPRTKHPRLRSA